MDSAARLALTVGNDRCGDSCCEDNEDDIGYDSSLPAMQLTPARSVSTCGDNMHLPYDTASERKDSKVTTVTNLSPCGSTEALHQVEGAVCSHVSDDSFDDDEVMVKNGKTVSWTRSDSGNSRDGAGDWEGDGEGAGDSAVGGEGDDGEAGEGDTAGDSLLSRTETDVYVSHKHCDFAGRMKNGDFSRTTDTSTVERPTHRL